LRRRLVCECGFEVASSDLELVLAEADRHRRAAHGLGLSRDHLLALVRTDPDPQAETRELK